MGSEMCIRDSVERASIMLLDKESGELKIFSSRGIPQRIVRSVRIKLGEGISGKVALTGKPILIENVDKYEEKIFLKESKFETKSFLSYPLVYSKSKSKKEIIGVINATDKKTGEVFTNKDIKLISSVSTLATMAIQNSELYSKLDKAYKDLKEKSKIILNTQKALIRTERLSSLGTLSASVAHEIKSPLTSIMGAAQMISLRKSQVEDVLRYAGIIEAQCSQISSIMSQLLNFSRQSKPERKEESINKVVEDTLIFTKHHLSRFKNVKIKKKFNKNLPKVFIDRGQIQQVFVNLINNAAQSMPDGGTLFIKTSLVRYINNEKEKGKNLGKSYVVVSFIDTGIGIKKKDLKNIFKPFFTTKRRGEGTGLGLSISKDIMKNHNGELKVRSREGKGACFEVLIPV